jgi:hypothetical protein
MKLIFPLWGSGDFSLKTNVLFRKGRGLTLTFDGQIHLAFNRRVSRKKKKRNSILVNNVANDDCNSII